MSNLSRTGGSGMVDIDGDGNPDIGLYRTITTKASIVVNPRAHDAVGKSLTGLIMAFICNPLIALKEFWGWSAVAIAIISLLLAVGRKDMVEPETKNFTDNFKPEVIGTRAGYTARRTAVSITEATDTPDAVAGNLGTRRRSNVE